MSNLKLNDSFKSFEEVKNVVQQFSDENLVSFYIRDSKTLQSIAKTKPLRVKNANPHLKYYMIQYSCIHGGKEFKSRGNNLKRTYTMKDGCPAKLLFFLTNDQNSLNLVQMDTNHNHTASKQIYNSLPKKRKLSEEDEKEVCHLLSMRCNNKIVKDYIQKKTGKEIILRDITSLKYKMDKRKSKSDGSSVSDLQNVINFLKKPNTIVEVVTNIENELVGIFYQDFYMMQYYAKYPEILLCDATYKLNNLRMPLYLLVVIDGNGHCEIVGSFLLADEGAEAIKKMIMIFKSNNPSWNLTHSILTDKDFGERRVFKDQFPNSNLLLCLFHVLKTFKTKITVETMNITSNQRLVVLEILQKIAYSENDSQYNTYYESLKELGFPKVLKYYEENWHNIRHEWVQGFKKQSVTFNTSTTNHLENLNQKIKQVCLRYSNIYRFYQDFLTEIDVLRHEASHIRRMVSIRRPVTNYTKGSVLDSYSRYVTPSACKAIETQYLSSDAIQFLDINLPHYFEFLLHGETIKTKFDECGCNFHTDRKLPCKHIFAYRKIRKMPLYDETLVHQKYSKSYYTNNTTSSNISFDINNFGTANLDNVEMSVINTNTTIYTQQQKFKEMQNIFGRLATVISEQGTSQYHKTREQIKLLVELINNHKEFLIVEHIQQNVDESIRSEWNSNDKNCANHENGEKNENIDIEINDTHNNTEKLDETQSNNISSAKEAEFIDNVCEDESGKILIESHEETIIESMCAEEEDDGNQNNKDESGQNQSNNSILSNDTCAAAMTDFHKPYYYNDHDIKERDDDNESNNNGEMEEIEEKPRDGANVYCESKVINERQVDKQNNIGMKLDSIKLPLTKKSRGRPKNIDVTAIGIKKVKKLKGPQLFADKRLFQRQQLMLECFLQKDKIKQILYNNELITETYISNLLLDKINCMILEEGVNVSEIQPFFTSKAFKQFQELLEIRKTTKNYFCSICSKEILDDIHNSICCDSCLKLDCTAARRGQKTKYFCVECRRI